MVHIVFFRGAFYTLAQITERIVLYIRDFGDPPPRSSIFFVAHADYVLYYLLIIENKLILLNKKMTLLVR